MKLNLYRINKDYHNYICKFDSNISISVGIKQTRPFIGNLIFVNGEEYLAPLTSPKQKHLYMKNSMDFMKIDNGKLGAINFNNMLPIPEIEKSKIRIKKIENTQYANLLEMQIRWCNQNKSEIIQKAEELYSLVITGNIEENYEKRCCNFKYIERKSMDYMNLNYVQESIEEYICA